MNKHKIILQILLFGFTCSLFSQSISKDDAVNIAIEFLQKQYADNGIMTINSTDTAKTLIVEDENRAYMYVVEAIDGDWVIVSADERIAPILGYGKEGFPAVEDMPPAMIDLINGYSYEMQYIFDSLNITTIHPERLGDTEDDTDEESDGSFVYTPGECLLNRPNRGEVNWDQQANNDYKYDIFTGTYIYDKTKAYNKFCPPRNTEFDNKGYVGCSAVAMGQIMWYWQWPHTSIVPKSVDDQNNYSTEETLQLYDWELMTNKITNTTPIEQADMVAIFLRDCAFAVQSEFSYDGTSSNITKTKNALENIFSYNVNKHYKKKGTLFWKKKLRKEINNGRPIYYRGRSSSGHAFVVDGYSATDKNLFHINWGWRGDHNGYFYLDNLTPEGHNYNSAQAALFGIEPNPSCEDAIVPDYTVEHKFGRYGTNGVLTANKKVKTGKIAVYYSGTEVILAPGFEIELGAELYADIQHFPCNLVAPLSIEYAPSNHNNEEKQKDNINIIYSSYHKNLEITQNNTQQIKEINIYSITGDRILTTTNLNINTTSLNKGIYIIKIIYVGENYEINKFII